MERITATEYYLPCDYNALEWREETNRIILHHSAGPVDQDIEDIARYHVNSLGWSAIGYHYLVDRDGQILLGRPRGAVGAHAYGANYDSVGICVIGNYNVIDVSERQLLSLALLCANLISDYDLVDDDILPHRYINSDTSCPGSNILSNLTRIRALATSLCRDEWG